MVHAAAVSTFALSAAVSPRCAEPPQASSLCPCLQNVAVDLRPGSQLVLGGSTRYCTTPCVPFLVFPWATSRWDATSITCCFVCARIFRLRGAGLHAGQKRAAAADLATEVPAKQGRTGDAVEAHQSHRDTGQQGVGEPAAAPSQGQFANLIRQEVRPRSSPAGGALKGHVPDKPGQQGSRGVHRYVDQQMKRRTSDLYDALPPERQTTT